MEVAGASIDELAAAELGSVEVMDASERVVGRLLVADGWGGVEYELV